MNTLYVYVCVCVCERDLNGLSKLIINKRCALYTYISLCTMCYVRPKCAQIMCRLRVQNSAAAP